MYAYIKGTLTQTTSCFAVVEAGGVGYLIHIPANSIGDMPPIGSEALLYISFVVREQLHALFGFLTKIERELFDILLQVTGIGPKTAISIIGHMKYEELIDAIKKEDVKKMCRIPGIGKKTAERLFLEIGDKLSSLQGVDPTQFTLKGSIHGKEGVIHDALSGLINLGYNQASAARAIQKALELDKDYTLAALITSALKHI